MKQYIHYIAILVLLLGVFGYGLLTTQSEEEKQIEACRKLNKQINLLTPEQLYHFLQQGENALEMNYVIHQCEEVGVEVKYEFEEDV